MEEAASSWYQLSTWTNPKISLYFMAIKSTQRETDWKIYWEWKYIHISKWAISYLTLIGYGLTKWNQLAQGRVGIFFSCYAFHQYFKYGKEFPCHINASLITLQPYLNVKFALFYVDDQKELSRHFYIWKIGIEELHSFIYINT